MFERIQHKLQQMDGKVGFYYKNLVSGEVFAYQAEERFEAASVIKIPIMVEVFRQVEEGILDFNQMITVHKEDKMPSCGALTYMHDGLRVTLKDLTTLMIILSDNTATNLLINLLGMEQINRTLLNLSITKTTINRLLFDAIKAERGIQNYITPKEITYLLELMYEGKLISQTASDEMLRILSNQRLNGKIPFYITDGTKVAHKTGEDSGISHDVGIVYAKDPFVVAFCSNQVEVPTFERLIQEVTRNLMET